VLAKERDRVCDYWAILTRKGTGVLLRNNSIVDSSGKWWVKVRHVNTEDQRSVKHCLVSTDYFLCLFLLR